MKTYFRNDGKHHKIMVPAVTESTLIYGRFRNGKHLVFMVPSVTESTIPLWGVFYRRCRVVTCVR